MLVTQGALGGRVSPGLLWAPPPSLSPPRPLVARGGLPKKDQQPESPANHTQLIMAAISANSFPGQPLQGRVQEQLSIIIPNPEPPSPPPGHQENRQGCRRWPWLQPGSCRPLPSGASVHLSAVGRGKAGLSPQPRPTPAAPVLPSQRHPHPRRPPALSVSQGPSMSALALDCREGPCSISRIRHGCCELGPRQGGIRPGQG